MKRIIVMLSCALLIGEGAFAGAVKAGHPNTDLVARTCGEAIGQVAEKTLVVARETVSDLILADFALELVLGVTGIVDDRGNLSVNRAGLIKDVANDFHIFGCA